MISTSVAPSPQTYNIPQIADPKKFSFGIAREKFEKVYLKENPPIDKNLPAPNFYKINSSFVERAPAAYSFRPNTSVGSMFSDPNKLFPGPGMYDGNKAFENKNGYYLYSKYKSPGNAIISKSGKRFDNRDMRRSMELPGPGQYKASVALKYKQ